DLLLRLKAKAIAKAKKNAENMLTPLNQKVGNAIFISDTNTSLMNQSQGKISGVNIRGASSIYGSRSSEDLIIDFEKIEFKSRVNVIFTIE
ncbi:MAG: SIMPL domain-containing protein, partial [Psychroserpens sp.]|nr:SIMPL domain-containing protein [Psychroserpens sp.]